MVSLISFFVNFDDVNFQDRRVPLRVARIFKVSYLRNYCSYCLYIYVDEGMKTTLSESQIKFKNIREMRE